jgi:hypothetical protein
MFAEIDCFDDVMPPSLSENLTLPQILLVENMHSINTILEQASTLYSPTTKLMERIKYI